MSRGISKVFLVVFLLGISLIQCTKENATNVGSGLIPDIDDVLTKDTLLNIIANNIDGLEACDSVSHFDFLAFGTIDDDPLFGSTSAEMYFEMKPAAFPLNLPTHDDNSIEIDSVVLVLSYSHTYGDTNRVQKVTVHQLDDELRYDSLYLTCTPHGYSPHQLGEASFVPWKLKDSIFGLNEASANQLRIRLDNSFGSDLLDNLPGLTNDTLFREYFKGFALIPDETTGGGGLNFFNLQSADSRLSVYIRYKNGGEPDTTSVNIGYTSISGQANYIRRDRKTSEVTQYLDGNPLGDSLLFMQTMPSGVFAELQVPGLDDFPNVLIHKAEIRIQSVYDPSNDIWGAPLLLYMDIKNDEGDYVPIPCDFTSAELQNGFLNIGGRPLRAKDADRRDIVEYVFNIQRYIQSALTKKKNKISFRLRAPAFISNSTSYVDPCGMLVGTFDQAVNNLAAGRAELNGTQQDASGIKLKLVYSREQ